MHLDVGTTIARIEAHALLAGISLQVVACLMNESRFHKVQIGVGVLGVALMIIGFRGLAK